MPPTPVHHSGKMFTIVEPPPNLHTQSSHYQSHLLLLLPLLLLLLPPLMLPLLLPLLCLLHLLQEPQYQLAVLLGWVAQVAHMARALRAVRSHRVPCRPAGCYQFLSLLASHRWSSAE